jgi:two-component system, LytTR family, sensor kinase
MKKYFFILLFVAAVGYQSRAFTHLPTLALSISRDSQTLPLRWTDWLLEHAEVFVDSTGERTFEAIQQQSFVPLPQQYITRLLGLGNARNRYWIRFKIQNTHAVDTLKLVFVTYHPYVHIFEIKTNRVVETAMDFYAPSKYQAEGAMYHCTYSLAVAPQQTTELYAKIGERGTPKFAWHFKLYTTTAAHQDFLEASKKAAPNLLFNSFFLGTMALMAATALMFFYFTRQRAYLYYGCYLLGLFFTFLRSFEELGDCALFYTYSPIVFKWSEGLWAAVTQLSYSAFLINILDLKTTNRRAYRVLKFIFDSSFFYIALDGFLEICFFKENFAQEPYILYRIAGAILAIIAIWHLRHNQTPVTRLIIYGSLIFVLSILATIPFSLLQGQLKMLDHLIILKTGIFIEMLFFMAALAFRTQAIERERRLHVEANNQLLQQLAAQADLKRRAAEAELRHTRSQMRAHLLFNVLNSAKNQVLQQHPAEASAQLADLATFIRQSLAHSRHAAVSLQDELMLLKKYIDLERRRLSDAFEVVWQVETDFTVDNPSVPALLLQPFVENAILHGLLPKNSVEAKILTVQVQQTATDFICHITDNGVGRPRGEVVESSFGLALTQERVELFNELYRTHIQYAISDVRQGSNVVAGTLVQVAIPLVAA